MELNIEFDNLQALIEVLKAGDIEAWLFHADEVGWSNEECFSVTIDGDKSMVSMELEGYLDDEDEEPCMHDMYGYEEDEPIPVDIKKTKEYVDSIDEIVQLTPKMKKQFQHLSEILDQYISHRDKGNDSENKEQVESRMSYQRELLTNAITIMDDMFESSTMTPARQISMTNVLDGLHEEMESIVQ